MPLLLPVLAAAVLLAAGCGGTSNSTAAAPAATAPSATTPSSGGGFRPIANSKFTDCLKAHGVSLPSGGFSRRRSANGQPQTGQPRSGGGAFSNPKTRAAFQACRTLLPNGGRFGRGGGFGRPGATSAVFAKYRACLTAHGVKLTGGGPFAGANVASPAFQAAAKACHQYAPKFGGGGTPPTTTG